MTSEYARHVLKLVVAQICQTIGWHSINSTPLEFMTDLMQEYIFRLSKLTHQYAQVLGRSEANLDDLGLAFQHLNIDLNELVEYIRNVDPVPCVVGVPKLPIQRESHLNFLKPGSREVVTRPVHVHEHLPAMYPEKEEEYSTDNKSTEILDATVNNEVINSSEDDSSENSSVVTANGILTEESPSKVVQQAVFKRPGDPISLDGTVLKRAKTTENGRPLREIDSVIMTTTGFLSTAREGKLPEARTPHQERAKSPTPPPETPAVISEIKVEKKLKKIPKKALISEDGKPENKENKKKKIPKDILFEPDEIKEVKKLAGMKELAKLKVLKPGSKVGSTNLAGPSNLPLGKISGKIPGGSPKHAKNNTFVNKIKSEKHPDVVQNTGNLLNVIKEEPIDKLPIEPDKQKLNIFKKISSKPKEDKDKDFSDSQHKLKDHNSCDNSTSVIVNDTERYRNDTVVKQDDKKSNVHNPVINNKSVRVSEDSVTNMMSPGSDVYMFDDMSPPRTPSTPKTPDINVSNITVEQVQKKKKKDKSGKKKEPKIKIPKNIMNPKKARLSNDSLNDISVLDRPKTPQALEQSPSRDVGPSSATLPFPFFTQFPTAPGLIPQPMFPPFMQKGIIPPAIMGAPNSMIRPNMPLHFLRPPAKLDINRPPLVPPSFVGESTFPMKQPSLVPPSQHPRMSKPQEPVLPWSPQIQETMAPPTLINSMGINRSLLPPSMAPPSSIITPALVPAPLLPPNSSLNPGASMSKPIKPEKLEKALKKLKEHKKKDKLKKKKEKKDKHKEKGEKIKEKKDKSEKKEKLEKIREKKEKKEKRKEKEANKKIAKEGKVLEAVPKITLKLGPAGGSPRPPTPDSALMKKITIKPPKKPDEDIKREPTPELARISALVTRPPKQKTKFKPAIEAKKEDTKEDKENGGNTLASKSTVSVDSNGRKVWICPACGKQDDGSAMIGCDDCDAWYHWVCVGIQVAPADNEDWYCLLCIAKKQEQYHDKKKKKRKKKNA